jgi:hypothetical protein
MASGTPKVAKLTITARGTETQSCLKFAKMLNYCATCEGPRDQFTSQNSGNEAKLTEKESCRSPYQSSTKRPKSCPNCFGFVLIHDFPETIFLHATNRWRTPVFIGCMLAMRFFRHDRLRPFFAPVPRVGSGHASAIASHPPIGGHHHR